ncbi:MAG: DUF5916 domain-containing protein [Gemmatimonadota bacterium]
MNLTKQIARRLGPSLRTCIAAGTMVGAMALAPSVSAQQMAADAATADSDSAPMRAGQPVPFLMATKVAGAAPDLDGRLDDAVWESAQIAGNFVQFQPEAGSPATFPTEVRVVYNHEAIYVGVRMYDTSPDSIVGRLARRDSDVYSDWVFVAMDSYGDRRTGFAFGVNPAGVKRDILLYDDVMETHDWDAIWDVAVSTDDQGWTAEFRIPLSQLRFSTDGTRAWGFEVRRDVARLNESSVWAPLDPDVNAVVSRFGELRGLQGLEPSRSVELLPYSLGRVDRANGNPDNPYFERTDPTGGFGGDIKVGLTSDITLNATINPDFGQVEADPSVVNLSAFETFLPEKRPFFVEGADIYRFGIGLGDGDLGNEGLFYSRRIGRAPRGAAPDAAEWSTAPSQSTILGAAKLSGKTAGGWSIGVLEAVTQAEEARWTAADGTRGRTVVEPFTNYTVGRVIRDFRAGRSALSLIGTAVNRRIDDPAIDQLHTGAYTVGASARHRWGGESGTDYTLSSSLVGSHVRGSADAISATQRAPARYYQRPDADYKELDPTRTTLSGWMSSTEVGKVGGGNWSYLTALNIRAPGFEVNDLGYQQDADQILHVGFVGYRDNTPGNWFRRWGVNLNGWNSYTFGGEHMGVGGNVNGNFQLHNRWGGHFGVNPQSSGLSVSALRGGPAIRTPSAVNGWGGLYSDDRKSLQGRLNLNWRIENETGGSNYSLSPSVNLRPSDRAQVSLGANWSRTNAGWQWVGRRTAYDESHFLYAKMDQTVLGLTARVAYTFTPTLSLELYAQPFLAAGDYDGFMEVSDPRAESFAGRFHTYSEAQISSHHDDSGRRVYAVDTNTDGTADFSFNDPDFNVSEFRSNAVLRWEYRPGSSLFVVWTQGRDTSARQGDFDISRDVDALFGRRAENVFLIKVSYWLGL